MPILSKKQLKIASKPSKNFLYLTKIANKSQDFNPEVILNLKHESVQLSSLFKRKIFVYEAQIKHKKVVKVGIDNGKMNIVVNNLEMVDIKDKSRTWNESQGLNVSMQNSFDTPTSIRLGDPSKGTTNVSVSNGGTLKEGKTEAILGQGNVVVRKTVTVNGKTTDVSETNGRGEPLCSPLDNTGQTAGANAAAKPNLVSNLLAGKRDFTKSQEITTNQTLGGIGFSSTIGNNYLVGSEHQKVDEKTGKPVVDANGNPVMERTNGFQEIASDFQAIAELPKNLPKAFDNVKDTVEDKIKLGERVLDGRLNLGQAMDTSGDIIKKRQEVIDGNKNKELANKINSGIADKDAEKTKEMLSEADQALGGNGKVDLYDSKEIPAEKMLGEHSADSKDNPGFITNEQGQKPEEKQVFINVNPETGTDLTNGSEIMGTLAHEENHRQGRNEVQSGLVGDIVEQAWTKENQYNGNTTGSQSPEAQQQTQEDWLARNGNSSTLINGTEAAAGVVDFEALDKNRIYEGGGILQIGTKTPKEIASSAAILQKKVGPDYEVKILPNVYNEDVKLYDPDVVYGKLAVPAKVIQKAAETVQVTTPIAGLVGLGVKVIGSKSEGIKQGIKKTVDFINTGAKAVHDMGQVVLEMGNVDQYSKKTAEYIKKDLKEDPIGKDKTVDYFGYSGNGQIGFNVADLLTGTVKINKLITAGSPVIEKTHNNIGSTTHIISEADMFYFPIPALPITTMNDKNSKIIIYKYEEGIKHNGVNSYLTNEKVLNDIAKEIRNDK